MKIRIPLLAYLLWALLSHLRDPWYGSLLFSGITLLIHEIGHVIGIGTLWPSGSSCTFITNFIDSGFGLASAYTDTIFSLFSVMEIYV